MDARNVRILPPYIDRQCEDDTVYIDEKARYSLHAQWGDQVMVVGRNKRLATIQPLKEEDWGGQMIRMNQKMCENIYCCIGDEVLLYRKE